MIGIAWKRFILIQERRGEGLLTPEVTWRGSVLTRHTFSITTDSKDKNS